jgi:V8-like Glu-specific endopeptidase
MLERDLQEWEEYDARWLEHDSPFQSPTALHPLVDAHAEAFVGPHQSSGSPFLIGDAAETELHDNPSPHICNCGRTSSIPSGETEGRSLSEGFEETNYSELPNSQGENELSPAATCAAGCPDPSPAELRAIRQKGNPDGAVVERTQGDLKENLALQLIDYDVNAFLPTKARHNEGLARINEFIARRTRETTERIAVTITGSASRTGSSSYNDVLSCKRANCIAQNIRTFLPARAAGRVDINSAGEGFTRATCKGSDCELGEWRSVLVQVHSHSNPPPPLPVVDPGCAQYTIRCCSFHTTSWPEVLLSELLNKGLPNIPANLKGPAMQAIRKGLAELKKQLLKGFPKLAGAAEGLEKLLELFPAEIIQETGVFEISERGKANPRVSVLCYSGWGLRIIFPRTNIDQFLNDAMNKVPGLQRLVSIKKLLIDLIKNRIPNALKTLVQPIQSDSPGPAVNFDLLHPRNMRVFEGRVQVGKGVWMPGEVNLEFDSPPWHRPDPVQRPHISSCPGATCNDSGVQTVVGDGHGLEFFSITAGNLAIGSCRCQAAAASEAEGNFKSEETGELQNEGEQWTPELEMYSPVQDSSSNASRENEYGNSQEKEAQLEALEIDPYSAIRPALLPEHASLSAGELTVVLGRRPAIIALHRMLSSPEPQLASLAVLLGSGGKRVVRLNSSNVPVSSYLHLLSRLCREAAEQSEVDSGLPTRRENESQISLERPTEEFFSPSDPPKNIADALTAKNWASALALAIQAGMHDATDLTNLIFFAKHPELGRIELDPANPKFKQLSAEWSQLLNGEVWKAIVGASENTALAVHGSEVADEDRFFWGPNGKRLKQLVLNAAKEVDINPGLLGAIMMAETRRPQSYLSSERVSSYHIGTDDFYEGRAAIAARVPAYKKVKWDKNQTPMVHDNDATTPRQVQSIVFDSGPDAVLATAVYLKFREVRLREIAAESKKNFDSLPVEIRFALTRIAMAAGTGGATPLLRDALNGKDILIRKYIPVKIYQTQRNATVRTAQALHLSDWIFGIPIAPSVQNEVYESEGYGAEPEISTETESAEATVHLTPAGLLEDRIDSEIGKFNKGSAFQVSNTQTVPFQWICNLEIGLRVISPGGSERRTGPKPLATGVLISPCHVLTAAHVLSDRQPVGDEFEHLLAERVWVIPGRDGENGPRGKIEAKSWKLNPKWNPDKSSIDADYALITLEKPFTDMSFWGDTDGSANDFLDSLPDSVIQSLIGHEITTAGYPESKNKQMWCFKGNLSVGSPELDANWKKQGAASWFKGARRFGITADAEKGQSGSPVWVTDDGKRYLVGVLTDAGEKLNWAVVVNADVVLQLREWMRTTGCPIAPKANQELEFSENELQENYVPVSFEGEDPLPKGVPEFEHFFQPMKADASGINWVSKGAEEKLEPLNPGFIDDKDNLENSALQDNLVSLLIENEEFSRYLSRDSLHLRKAGATDKIRVALIDLTGKRNTEPQFAGWGSTVAIDSGSAVKVAVLYAAFQLKADLEHIANSEGIHSTPELCNSVDQRWQKTGIVDRPKLAEIFHGDQNPPRLAFAEDIQDAVNNISTHEANTASSVLIRKIGFPFIASVLWRSGLRHPKRGGLWLLWNYDDANPQEWNSPARPAPGPVFPHTSTALSLATFFALLGQGRLANPASSAEMKRSLRESWYRDVLPSASFSSKVGLLYNTSKCTRWEIKHGQRVCTKYEVSAALEGDFIENGKLRYAVAIMTVGIPEGIEVLKKLAVQLDELIRKNNP